MNDLKLKILIVEDDADMAQLNSRLLKRQGYETIVANTAAEARVLFNENLPDLVVLDITLPDGDGRTLCKTFRKTADVPVLFLTGKSETQDRIKSLNIGGDYYLIKPYDRNEYVAVVRNLLRRAERARKKIDEASVIKRGPITLSLSERKAYVDGRDAELTPKEFAVLLILIQNEEKEVPYETIYSQVWRTPMNNDVSALRQQILRLRKKIGDENTDSFSILNEHGKGYTFTTK